MQVGGGEAGSEPQARPKARTPKEPAIGQSSAAFELNIGLAPLEIIGQQEVNLFITKLIVLPLIIVVNGIPVPYNGLSKAQSKSAIFIIPTAPVGRSIAGRRSGSIVDLGQVCVFVATIVTAAATAAV